MIDRARRDRMKSEAGGDRMTLIMGLIDRGSTGMPEDRGLICRRGDCRERWADIVFRAF